MDEIAILDVLRRHSYLIAALTIVTTVAGYGLTFVSDLIPEKYEASAVLLVRPQEPIKLAGQNTEKEFLDFPVSQTSMVETAAKTYIEIIESPELISEVVRTLKMDKEPVKKEELSGSLFAYVYRPAEALYVSIKEYIKDLVAIFKYGRLLKDDPFTQAVKHVAKGLSLKAYEDTYVFEIKYSDEDPQRAADVANNIARLFIAFMEKVRASEAKSSGDRLKSELEQSRQRLANARRSLEDYKASHKVFLYKQEYDAKLKVISDLEIELAKLDESLVATQGTLAARSYELKRARIVGILNARKAELAELPSIERGLQLRQADVDVAGTSYEIIAKSVKDAEIKSTPVPEARLISRAAAPLLPSRPRRDIITLSCFLGGLLGSVILAFFLEYINRRVRGIQDVEDSLGLKVLATIPPAKKTGSWNWLTEPTI
jgi:uncharacterized protein involved in exopolysaccharide biosynthesis